VFHSAKRCAEHQRRPHPRRGAACRRGRSVARHAVFQEEVTRREEVQLFLAAAVRTREVPAVSDPEPLIPDPERSLDGLRGDGVPVVQEGELLGLADSVDGVGEDRQTRGAELAGVGQQSVQERSDRHHATAEQFVFVLRHFHYLPLVASR